MEAYSPTTSWARFWIWKSLAPGKVSETRHEPESEISMPTGPLHYRTYQDSTGIGVTECRCMIGADHLDDGSVVDSADDEGAADGLSVWDAAEIWASRGKDEDDTFGFSAEELEQALNEN
ncbi:hypothetical protein ACFVU2_17995 [Leifsonia sp. NPDC058194]|uniref:hypothetical protein n=1 Tax=Leifsonia sp. NPDC058194 TaxID=3346374 RepID=UPI0036D9C6BB